MTQKHRKLGFYELDFYAVENNVTQSLGDNAINAFVNIFDFLTNCTSIEDKSQKLGNKVCFVKSIENIGLYTYKILFIKTGNHKRPELLDTETFTERENPKTINEGDQIKTHLTLKFYPTQLHKALVVLEENLYGVGITQFMDYIVYLAKKNRGSDSKANYYKT